MAAGGSPYSSDKKRRPRTGWSRRSPARILLALVGFFILTYAVGYAAPLFVHLLKGSPSAASPASPGGSDTYEDAAGGFSLKYPASWVHMPYFSQTGDQVTPYAKVTLGDPQGAGHDTVGIDLITVTVAEAPAFTEAMRPLLLPFLNQQVASMAAKVPGLKVTEPPEEFVTDSGLRGVRAGIKAKLDGQTVVSEMYIFRYATAQYQIVVQAAEKNWPSDKLLFDAAARSFRLTGGDASI
jgi:hypothetical protein